MHISLKLISNNSTQFVQQRFIQSISEQHKAILAIAVAALALLVVGFMIMRGCFRKAEVIEGRPKMDGDQPAQKIKKEKESPVKPVEDAIVPEASAKEELKQAEPADAEPSPAKSIVEHPEKESEGPIAGENLKECEFKEDVAETEKDESPKKTLAQLAAGVDLHTGFMIQAIDQMLTEKKDLSQVDKDKLAVLKGQELQKRDIVQSLIDMERREISRLKDEEVAINAELSAKQAKLVDLKKEIGDKNEKIQKKEKAIADKLAKIDQLSQGNHEQVLKKVSYSPDDQIEKLGVIYKAGDFKGNLKHEIKIDDSYLFTTEAIIAAMGKPREWDMVIRGDRFSLVSVRPSGHHGSKNNYYWLETEWQRDGALPWFEFVWITPKAFYNQATIINLKSEVPMDNDELKSLQDRLQSREKGQQELDVEIAHLKDDLTRTQARLKEKGEPPQPLKPTP